MYGFIAVVLLFIAAVLCGFICGSIRGCNDSIKARTEARMDEREQIRRHEAEDRQREIDRLKAIEDRRQRRLDDLETRDRLLNDAVAANSQNRNRDAEIRTFAMREVPSVWNAFLALRGEVNSVNADLAAYRQQLTTRGVSPDDDAQHIRLKTIRNAMVRRLHDMEAKLDAAYMESLRAEITPGGSALSEETRNALSEAESGVSEVLSRYHEIGGNK